MAVAKPKKREQYASLDVIENFLVRNDKRLYGERATIKSARLELERSAKVNVRRSHFRDAVRRVCQYFRHPDWGSRSPSRGNALTAMQWEKLVEVLNHLNTVMDIKSTDVTLSFIVRMCRREGALANQSLLMNCSAFHRLTKGRFKELG
jgi:hypothetical protein